MNKKRPHNTCFASGGVTCNPESLRNGALNFNLNAVELDSFRFQKLTNSKPENVIGFLKIHTTKLLILNFMSVANLFGQDKLSDNIISDSLIRNQKTQRTHINYFYHKFIDNYEYNQNKNEIVETQYYYDWNPYRERRKGDTIVKKTTTKYNFDNRRKIKTKLSPFERFQPRLTFDNTNRLTERIDTIKCGYNITYFTYDKNNKVIERKHYTSHHLENPYLFAVDSLHYNLNGQLVKETNFYDIKITEDKWVFDREVLTTFSYYQNGLIQEKTNVTKYESQKNRNFKPIFYRYEYEFY